MGEKMKQLSVLLILTVVACCLLWTGYSQSQADTSSISPLPIPNVWQRFAACHDACLAEIPLTMELVLSGEYYERARVCECACRAEHLPADEQCVPATPTPTVESGCCEGWWQIELWMGMYPLWTNGVDYYVEGWE